ncbi:MAG TPA: CoA transferase [Dehalococcoidia bacterium]|nr:CoA transferase [Dehalococcoidia bacterium]
MTTGDSTQETAAQAVGALDGLRIIELTDEKGAWAGKLLADMGADVVKIEPIGGDATREYPPFHHDEPNPERSLYFWHYNTSKQGITLDIKTDRGKEIFKSLVAGADAVVESQVPGKLARLGIDYADLRESNPGMIWVSITPFGREGPRSQDQATDLTLLAGGGIAWMNGYDDHSLPPVRGAGNQGYHTGCHYGVMSFLVALLHRDMTGEGQFIDVNTHASCNVTTEAGSYSWMVAEATVERQTGRHASAQPSLPSQVRCSDGRYVNTGLPPRRPREFGLMREWMADLGVLDSFEQAEILKLAAEGPPFALADIAEDDMVAAKFAAGREAVTYIASLVPAAEFFSGGQSRGFQVGIIHSPEEMLEDPHFKARGFPVEVAHPELDGPITYPGAPYKLPASPWRIRRRAPQLGEDNASVYGELGIDAAELKSLRSDGVI